MKRADRKTSSDDNAANNPIGRKREPIPDKDIQKILATVRSQRDEFKQKVEEKTQEVEVIGIAYVEEKKKYDSTLTLYQTVKTAYVEEKKKYDSTLTLYQTVKTQYNSTHTLYVEEQRKRQVAIEELQKSNQELQKLKTQAQSYFRLHQDSQTKAQSYLTMYDLEKVKGDELETQLNELETQLNEVETQYNSTRTLYIEEQRKAPKGKAVTDELEAAKTQARSYFRLYQDSQTKAQSYLTMYDSEKVKRDELTIQLNTVKTQYKSTLTLYAEEQRRARKGESAIEELEAAKTQAQSYFRLHQDSQTQAQSYLTMYDSEKVRGDELVIQLNEVQGHRDRYLTLYNESQSELKTERRSKAGVKGWETRRKKENQKLKQEISEMAIVLRDSMERKDEAINSLYSVAERMDRIQRMVDLVDDDAATNPIGMVQKLQRMWQAVKEILAE